MIRSKIEFKAQIMAMAPRTQQARSEATVIELFAELNRQGLTIIVVTHNSRLADAAHRRLALCDGHLS